MEGLQVVEHPVSPAILYGGGEAEETRLALAKEVGNPYQWLAGNFTRIDGDAVAKWLRAQGCKHESPDPHYWQVSQYPGFLPQGALLRVKELMEHGGNIQDVFVVDPNLARLEPRDPWLVYHIPGSGGPWQFFLLHQWELVGETGSERKGV